MHLMPVNQPNFVFIVTIIIIFILIIIIIIIVIIAVIILISYIMFCWFYICHSTKSTVLIPHPNKLCRAVESEDATETEALLSAAEQGQAGTGKFFYFTTFVQAALIVHELHLLDLASLRQVTLCIMACTSMYLNVLLCTLGCMSMYLDVSLCILLKEALPNYSANLTEKSASSKICI